MKALLAVLAVLAFGVSAGSASADSNLTLDLSAPEHVVVGKPAILYATGNIPRQDLEFPYWFSLHAIPASVTTTCPNDHFEAEQLARSVGGSVLTRDQRELPDSNGDFTIQIGVSPTAADDVLLCGYTDDGLTNTLVRASLIVHIEPSGSSSGGDSSGGGRSHGGSGVAAIVNDARAGVRGCRAVLSGREVGRCIRDVLADERARCRKLHGRKTKKRCLRAVRRVR